jgi:hypothetical protein
MFRSPRSSFAAQRALCASLVLATSMSAQTIQPPAIIDTKPVLEAKTQAFIDAVSAQGSKPIYTLPYAEARAVLENAQSGTITKLSVKTESKTFPVGPTGSVSARIYRPEELPKTCLSLCTSMVGLGPGECEYTRPTALRPGR